MSMTCAPPKMNQISASVSVAGMANTGASLSSLFPCLVVLLCAISSVGCGDAQIHTITDDAEKTARRNARVRQAVYSALTANNSLESQVWQEFLTHWPDARPYDGLVWDRNSKKFRTTVTATAIIEDRYVFKFILDSEVSEDFQKVTFQKLRFHFFEVKEVVIPPEGAGHGGTMTTFQPDQKWLGLTEWKRLVDANWDFSKIGITIISNTPIPNIRSVPNL